MESQVRILGKEDEASLSQVFYSWSDEERKEKRVFHRFEDLKTQLSRSIFTCVSIGASLSGGAFYGVFQNQQLCSVAFLAEGVMFEILLILTRKDQQGKGFAGQLIEALAQKAHQQSIPEIWLEVHVGNQEAISFYQSKGFTSQEVRQKYYRDGSSALNMCYFVQHSVRI